MSLLDLDEDLLAIAQKADVIYGPLVDATEVPEGIDVALVEGAISSQDDLKKDPRDSCPLPDARRLRRLCRNEQRVVGCGTRFRSCALLQRVYVDGGGRGAADSLRVENVAVFCSALAPVPDVPVTVTVDVTGVVLVVVVEDDPPQPVNRPNPITLTANNNIS